MPKILKQGKLPEEEEFIVICSNCHTEFSFLRREAKPEHGDLTIDCPFCSKLVRKYFNNNYWDR